MTVPRWLPAVLGVAGLALVGFALLARKTDEERIREKLSLLEQALVVNADTATNPLFRKAQLDERFAEVFEAGVVYRIPDLSSAAAGTGPLVALAVRATMSTTSLDVSFSDVDVRVPEGATLATVETTAVLNAVRGGAPERDTRHVHFDFSSASGDWRVSRLDVSPRRD